MTNKFWTWICVAILCTTVQYVGNTFSPELQGFGIIFAILLTMTWIHDLLISEKEKKK